MFPTGIFIVGAVRTAIGGFQGSLKDTPPITLGAICIKEALRRAAVAPEEVGHVVMGHVLNTEARDMYLARVAAVEAGIPESAAALTVNRLCGSGLQALVSAAQTIALGDCDIAVAGGAESMSRSLHATGSLRRGVRFGDIALIDMMAGVLTDPFGHGRMGETAENVARKYDISRTEQDRLAAESQARAATALGEGRFRSQIVAVPVRSRSGVIDFVTDEHVRTDVTPDRLAGLDPVFRKDGTVTAGNASGLNDGAAALVLANTAAVVRLGLAPLARLAGYAHAGVAPSEMGIGPVPAVRRLLSPLGLAVGDFSVIESNEAFAAQACAVGRELGFAPEQVNPNGGAIALGHPIGATGAIIAVKAIYEMNRIGGRNALTTMCIGGGQGIAVAFDRAIETPQDRR